MRKKNGLTQKELAEKTGLSIATIQGYEQGKYKPKHESIKEIAKILHIPISILLDKNSEIVNDSFDNSAPPQVYCDFCHRTYSPYNKYQVKEHQEYHKKYKQAFDKFGKFLEPQETDKVLEKVRNVLNSKKSTEDEIYNAIIDGFDAGFSKSLYRSGLDINHVDYNTYCRYELEKSFYVNDIPSNVYFRLLEKYSGPHLTPSEFYPVRCHKEEPSRYSEETQQQKHLESAYSQLNFAGRNKAIELLELLTKIPEYLTEEEIEFRKIP